MSTIPLNAPNNSQAVPWSFLYLLRESNLLSEDQLADLQERLDGLDMPSLTALLLEQGWLTAYQLKRIREGQARGLVLGQYRVLDELGEGGFGKVYKAVHVLMNRVAALKVIAPKWAQSPRGRNLFIREVSAMTRLTHPNIAQAYDANQTDDLLWFAMEYVAGSNLEQFVLERQPLPIPFVCALMLQVAQALQFAHENGMVHRDVKPANILLAGAGPVAAPAVLPPEAPAVLVKLVDFGLAKILPLATPDSHSICQDGLCVGTPEYMSPEQARDSHQVDIRSDLYSLGCVFYFALTGRPPFKGATTVETVAHHVEMTPEPLANLRPGIPPQVADVVGRLMAKKPELRFQTPAGLVETLNGVLGNHFPQRIAPPIILPEQPSSLPGMETAPSVAAGQPDAPPAPEQGPPATRVLDPLPSAVGPSRLHQPGALAEEPAALWREWFAVVESLAQGTAPDWQENEYALLYKALLDKARQLAGSSSHPQCLLYARLETLVEPWLKLRALADLDPTSLIGLVQTCRRLDAELCPAPRVSFLTWIILVGFVAGCSALAAGVLIQGGMHIFGR